jgi:hypothetical protein
LPEHKIRSLPFEECAVDLIGPWTIQVRDKPYEFNTLTMIDTVLNLVELVRIDDKTSAHIAKKYAQVWLTRYPWPARCIYDIEGEFIGPEFQLLLEGCRIKDVPTPSKNPQANAICERMHQTVGNVLWTLLHGQPPQTDNRRTRKRFHRQSISNCNARDTHGNTLNAGKQPREFGLQ